MAFADANYGVPNLREGVVFADANNGVPAGMLESS